MPGEDAADATVDSRERFYAAIFAGYGTAWTRVARRRPIAAVDVRALSGVMLAGGIGRLVSASRVGRPHWFQDVLTAVEFVVPAAFLALAAAESVTRPDINTRNLHDPTEVPCRRAIPHRKTHGAEPREPNMARFSCLDETARELCVDRERPRARR